MIPYDKRSGKIWYNGELVDWSNVKVHVLSHGLHYASCVFEGERVYDGEIFKLEEHTERLFHSAKRMGIEGWVNVEFTVDDDGEILDVEIVDSSSQRFHQSAISAVYNWRFKPAIRDNEKVAVICRQRLKFELEK